MRELDLVAPWEETVENGGNLALENQLAVDQLHLLLGHLRSADTTSLLGTVWRRAVVFVLFVVVLFVFLQGVL
jgi:type II secretory pathway component PulL